MPLLLYLVLIAADLSSALCKTVFTDIRMKAVPNGRHSAAASHTDETNLPSRAQQWMSSLSGVCPRRSEASPLSSVCDRDRALHAVVLS